MRTLIFIKWTRRLISTTLSVWGYCRRHVPGLLTPVFHCCMCLSVQLQANPTDKKTCEQSLTQQHGSGDMDTVFTDVSLLKVKGSYSTIRIVGVADNKVELHSYIGKITYEAKFGKRKAVNTKELKVMHEKKGNELLLWVDAQEDMDTTSYKRVKIEMTVITLLVPADLNMKIDNSSGSINAAGLNGSEVQFSNEFGPIEVNNIHSALNLYTRAGNMSVKKVVGTITALCERGNFNVSDITGKVTLITKSGGMSLKNIHGSLNLQSAFGIQLLDSIHGNVVTDCASGNFTLKRYKGIAKVKSSFGTQVFEEVEGSLDSYSGSGDIKLSEVKAGLTLSVDYGSVVGKNVRLTANSEIKTSSGGIKLKLLNKVDDLTFKLQSVSGDLTIDKEGLKLMGNQQLDAGTGSLLIKGISAYGSQVYN